MRNHGQEEAPKPDDNQKCPCCQSEWSSGPQEFPNTTMLRRFQFLHNGSAAQADILQPNSRAGRNSKVLMKVNTAPIVIPRSRSGSESNHTMGKRINARMASGQHSTNKMHQPTNRIRVFMRLELVVCSGNGQLECKPKISTAIAQTFCHGRIECIAAEE